jgi:helicase required for RNAi-mediated heterochromatin assembly 1
MLNKQRRMVPNIRKLLTIDPTPFYENFQDHQSVLDHQVNRPPVPGMGTRDVHFFSHNWPECRNPDSSRYNPDEAQMIAGAFKHLILNGTEPSKITVLTVCVVLCFGDVDLLTEPRSFTTVNESGLSKN